MKDPLDTLTPDMFGDVPVGYFEPVGAKINLDLISEWLMIPSETRLPYLDWVHERKMKAQQSVAL